ncbi:MAG: iron ABC transporter permease [Bacteroidales bacterium]|nr:iron ABC transporter permease [Bacteroidales bacterium]MDD4529606.1 iron ABC transporter permease [Bacteroidales bacterium]MDD4829367.1 iron ABC transporter permease [Bacteroidales bacterium]
MKKDIFWYFILTIVVFILMLLGLFLGSVDIVSFDENSLYIIKNLRLPRVIMCVLSGAGLAVCGAAYQAIFRNPLSDPYTLGISSGASLGAAIAIVLGFDVFFFSIGSFAFLFALLTVWIIIRIASVGNRLHITTLLLAGISINFLIAALISIIMVINQDSMDKIIFWTMGSMSGSKFSDIAIVLPFVVVGIIIIRIYARDLNALLTGTDSARSLGVNVERTKKLLLFFSTLMIGVIVSYCGVIGFVGLIVPHIIRLLVGADNRRIIPYSIFGGMIFMLLADIISRTMIAPSELPIGSITAIVGAPFFIYLLYNAKKKLNP